VRGRGTADTHIARVCRHVLNGGSKKKKKVWQKGGEGVSHLEVPYVVEDVLDLLLHAHLGDVDLRNHLGHRAAEGLEVNQGVKVLQLDLAEGLQNVLRLQQPELRRVLEVGFCEFARLFLERRCKYARINEMIAKLPTPPPLPATSFLASPSESAGTDNQPKR
jgi:hypothetical protein